MTSLKMLENVGLIYCYYLRKPELKDRYIKQYIDLAKAIISNFRPFLIQIIKKLATVSSSKLEIIILDLDLNNFIIA